MTELCGMAQHDHQPWPVFWTKSNDARLIGPFLEWRDPLNLVCEESSYHRNKRTRHVSSDFHFGVFIPKPKILEGAWTSTLSFWSVGNNYYHWMIDNLGRLVTREFLPESTRVLIPSLDLGFVSETLELLGMSQDCIAVKGNQALQPERFYLCPPLAMSGVWNPMAFGWLRSKFSPYFGVPSSGPPVFLTRRGTNRLPAILNQIEARFERAGFEIVDCSTIPVRKQIELTSAAPAIAGLHGAAMTNLLWASPNTPVLELFQPNYLNGCYEQIAFHGDLRYTHHVGDDGLLAAIDWWLVDSSTV